MRYTVRCWLLLAVAGLFSTVGSAQTKLAAAKPIADAGNALDVAYLPDRLTGATEDRWFKMNVHWPTNAKKNPCILFVHGGGYLGGDKDTNFHHGAIERAVRQGFVVANMNYILGRDLFPQVYYDFKAAVRFLRANADKYHIDPDRIGVWGFSAGGWLSTSSCFSSTGDIHVGNQHAVSERELGNGVSASALGKLRKADSFAVPMDDAQPAYGDYSSRVQALQIDLAHHRDNLGPDAPAVCTYVGVGGVSELEALAKKAGIDFLALALPGEKFRAAKSAHVPNLLMKVPTPDGKGDVELRERVLGWFQQTLVDTPRTPVPEFRPNRRVFADTLEVRVIVPSRLCRVHFTSDGSEPTEKSPVWKGAMTISKTTVVKALVIRDSMRPSGVATAVFVKCEVPPTITDSAKLPVAKVGEHFEAKFSIKEERACTWRLVAQYLPDDGIRYKGTFADFSGLSFDKSKGRLHGVPTRAGVYTLQVQAAWSAGSPADTRTYMLTVQPKLPRD